MSSDVDEEAVARSSRIFCVVTILAGMLVVLVAVPLSYGVLVNAHLWELVDHAPGSSDPSWVEHVSRWALLALALPFGGVLLAAVGVVLAATGRGTRSGWVLVLPVIALVLASPAPVVAEVITRWQF